MSARSVKLPPVISELLSHTTVRFALGIVALIAVGSLTYYLIASAPPTIGYAAVKKADVIADVTSTGVVSPVQNPTLSFQSGGQVSRVSVKAGDTVQAGAVLATLDTGIMSANLAAAQAKLDELTSGPRSTDLASKQTSVQVAQQSLNNTYTNYPQTLQSTYGKAQEAVYSVDSLFDNSTRVNPALNFATHNQTLKVTVDGERSQLNQMFDTWKVEVNAITASSSVTTLQSTSQESLNHLYQIRTYLTDLVTALNDAQIGSSFSQSQDSADLALANTARDTVNSLITSLSSTQQSIVTNQLSVQSAQDSLNQTLAGASSQDIQAQQAVVAGIAAQLRQQEIIAPFSGTVASVSVKPGDVVSQNSAAIALVPSGNFEVDIYLPENDMTKLHVGDAADITLDAYGANRTFPATVGTIETSPSIDPHSANGTSGGYKVTLVFANADPAIANGMHANAIVHGGRATNVLTIPRTAVITDGSQHFALVKTSSGLVKTPITIGITGSTTVEVQSGLTEGDKVSAVGAQ